MTDWLMIFAAFGVMLATVLLCLAILALGMVAMQKRGMK